MERAEKAGSFSQFCSVPERAPKTAGSPFHQLESSNALLTPVQPDPIWDLPQPIHARSIET